MHGLAGRRFILNDSFDCPWNCRFVLALENGDFYCDTPKPSGWFHLVLNFIGPNPGEGIAIYHDGVLIDSSDFKHEYASDPSDGLLVIGKGKTGGGIDDYSSVVADELRLYNRKLTPAEIATLYNAHA